ncbi:13104_t:CDS:1, partial [Funneliformis caledonium]
DEEDTQSLISDDILLNNNESNNNLLSLYIHAAIDINAKWNLHDLFIRELKKPEFISTLSEFN